MGRTVVYVLFHTRGIAENSGSAVGKGEDCCHLFLINVVEIFLQCFGDHIKEFESVSRNLPTEILFRI